MNITEATAAIDTKNGNVNILNSMNSSEVGSSKQNSTNTDENNINTSEDADSKQQERKEDDQNTDNGSNNNSNNSLQSKGKEYTSNIDQDESLISYEWTEDGNDKMLKEKLDTIFQGFEVKEIMKLPNQLKKGCKDMKVKEVKYLDKKECIT